MPHQANLLGGPQQGDLREANLNLAYLGAANLSKANLREANLRWAYLAGANLSKANLSNASLTNAKLNAADAIGAFTSEEALGAADLSGANLRGTFLGGLNLSGVNLSGADLRGAVLYAANLSEANLSKAKLSEANLSRAILVGTDLTRADLTGCRVYGVSAWGVRLEGTEQQNLVITPPDEPEARVDDLEVAQFFYLLLNRQKIRNVIDAVTHRGVLILGRFEDGGLALLQQVAAWLRRPENGGYLPLLFDFPRPDSMTYTETVRTLVSLARFVIVDLSGRSVPQEITATVDLHEIPLSRSSRKTPRLVNVSRLLAKERVVKPIVRFTDQAELLELLPKEVIARAEELIEKRQKVLDEIFRRGSPK